MLNRRLFLGGLLVGATAPAIIRAENAMKITVPRMSIPSMSMYDELAFFPHWNLEGTSTGRMSSKGSHLSTVPKGYVRANVGTPPRGVLIPYWD